MTRTDHLHDVPLDPAAWQLPVDVVATVVEHRGRPCLRFDETFRPVVLPGVTIADGVLELDLAVEPVRSFHGLVWRVEDDEDFESFFVRPHQVGHPDAIQYTPVSHDISSWQLYHGPGFWAPIAFPVGDWFTIRVAFAGPRAEVFAADSASPALVIPELKRRSVSGGIGLLVGGPDLHVARFAWTDAAPVLPSDPSRPADSGSESVDADPGVIRGWAVSEPFAASQLGGQGEVPSLARIEVDRWMPAEAEPGGLLDLGRLHGVRDGRDTVLVRTTVTAVSPRLAALELGFSDRVVVFLDGRPVFAGDDSYRSRDYRFLGSIGFWDTVYLPLEAGEHELVLAVSEDFGGWGLQARFADEVSRDPSS